jgi:hypothetical protein
LVSARSPCGVVDDLRQEKLRNATDGLPKPCQEKLPVGALRNGVSGVEFWDGSRNAGDGALPSSTIVAGSSDRTLHDLSTGRGGWVIRSRDGSISNNIVLTATFLNVLPQAMQATTLVHEAMHAIMKQTDAQLGALAHSYGQQITRSPDQDFQRWLDAGCPGVKR